MKKILNIIALALIVGFATVAVSCDKDNDKAAKEVSLSVYRGPIYYVNEYKFLELTANGPWTLKVEAEDGGAVDWASVSPQSGTGDARLVLALTKNPDEDQRACQVIIETEGKQYPFDVIQLGKADGDGTVQPTPPTPPSVTEPVQLAYTPSWRELPQMSIGSATQPIVAHFITLKGAQARNFTMLYDMSAKVALWVAYPLSNDYIGTVDRTDKWAYDPYIPGKDQANLRNTYTERCDKNSNGNWYDRGHQLPSADRTCSVEANNQTFYYSNMTPQFYKLNQNIWKDLEDKVRGWRTTCDTLYVVTGSALTTSANPTVAYAHDVDGKEIAAPRAYYKVVMKWKLDGTCSAIGFWLDNFMYGSVFETYPYSTKVSAAQATSVAQIEQKTGFTFFANSPTLNKSEFRPSDWGLQ